MLTFLIRIRFLELFSCAGVLLLTPSVIAQMLNPFRGKKPVIVPTTIQLTNPFGARLDITRVEMEVIINDTIVVGRAIQKNMNITVPRYVEGWDGWYGWYWCGAGVVLVVLGGTWWYLVVLGGTW
jgi:hypothetical protein